MIKNYILAGFPLFCLYILIKVQAFSVRMKRIKYICSKMALYESPILIVTKLVFVMFY